MATQVASNLVPKGGNTFYLLEDIYIKGGLQIRADLAARDAIPISNLKVGALVLCLDTGKCWQVATQTLPSISDPTAIPSVTWKEFKFGGGSGLGARAVAIHDIPALTANSKEEFVLNIGLSVMAFAVQVSRPCKVSVFSTPTKDESNPYSFLATADHLVDDGSSKMSDGSIFYSRRYSVLANLESPATNNLYVTVENSDGVEGPVTLAITYLTLEQATVS